MNQTIEYRDIHGNRNYKDSLFRMVFKKKRDLLELYNAINGTDYRDPEELEINTLDNVLYIGKKNDVSFVIGCTMNLFSSSLQKIPTPKYIVFYNGRKDETDRQVLRLSDAFQSEGGCLECEAIMLNINYGKNLELMEKCRRLEESLEVIEMIVKELSEVL